MPRGGGSCLGRDRHRGESFPPPLLPSAPVGGEEGTAHLIDELKRTKSPGRLLAGVRGVLDLDPVRLGREIDAGVGDGVLSVQVVPRAVELEAAVFRVDADRALEIPRLERPDRTVGAGAARVLPAMTRMIRDNPQRLPIEELAAACRLSPSRFMRLFREQMGVTAHQFLEKVRITEAGRLLRTTSQPIAAVAAACGFYDHSGFVKRFRQHTGLAPLAYRKSRHAILSGELAHVIRAGRENLSAV